MIAIHGKGNYFLLHNIAERNSHWHTMTKIRGWSRIYYNEDPLDTRLETKKLVLDVF